jgi:hypothetical protein
MPATLRFASLAQAQQALQRLRAGAASALPSPAAGPSLYQVLVHCAQSIEYSLTGYPVMKPALLRATIGPLVLRLFLMRGAMRHNLAAPVPGAPALSEQGELAAAWERLAAAMERFLAHTGPLCAHFLYGSLSKAQYERVHAMHLADHLSAFAL